jgi:hypothetical protein
MVAALVSFLSLSDAERPPVRYLMEKVLVLVFLMVLADLPTLLAKGVHRVWGLRVLFPLSVTLALLGIWALRKMAMATTVRKRPALLTGIVLTGCLVAALPSVKNIGAVVRHAHVEMVVLRSELNKVDLTQHKRIVIIVMELRRFFVDRALAYEFNHKIRHYSHVYPFLKERPELLKKKIAVIVEESRWFKKYSPQESDYVIDLNGLAFRPDPERKRWNPLLGK